MGKRAIVSDCLIAEIVGRHILITPLVRICALLATRLALTTALAIASAAPLAAEVVDTVFIDTRLGGTVGGWLALGGTTSGFGQSLVGQTFVAPPGVVTLERFSFFLQRGPSNVYATLPAYQNDFTLRGFVSEFVNGALSGPVLFTSAIHTRLANEPPDVDTPETFFTSGLALTPGKTYIAYIEPDPFNENGGRSVRWRDGDPYSAGALYNGALFPGQDAEFIAVFSIAPEPSTFALCLTGLLVMVPAFVTARKHVRSGDASRPSGGVRAAE